MDFDSGLVHHAAVSGLDEFRRLERMGIRAEILKGPAEAAWRLLEDYTQKYGTMPGLDLIKHQMGVEFAPIGANVEHLAQHVLRRHMWQVERLGMKAILAAIEEKNPERARELIADLDAQLRHVGTGAAVKAKNLFASGPQVLATYEQTKSGVIGLPLPWPTMNQFTMGLWPETVTLFFGRPGTGKTFVIVICMRTNHGTGRTALAVSPEMTTAELGERYFAIESDSSYRDVVAGQLGEFREGNFRKVIEDMSAQEGLHVLDDENDMKPEVIEEAAMDLDVDVIYLDSVYDIRVGSGKRDERMAAVSEWMRKLAKRTKKPVVAAGQLNRSQEGAKYVKMSGIALTDQLSWDAHNIIGMAQTADMRDDGVLFFDPVKVRRAAHARRMKVRWDFDGMNFDELAVEEVDGFEDDGFGDEDAGGF
jgi:replicative DNA helicase